MATAIDMNAMAVGRNTILKEPDTLARRQKRANHIECARALTRNRGWWKDGESVTRYVPENPRHSEHSNETGRFSSSWTASRNPVPTVSRNRMNLHESRKHYIER